MQASATQEFSSPPAQQQQRHHQHEHQHQSLLPPSPSLDSRFSCNICLDAVSEPVVTQCGHLYCWPCLFRWLEPGMLPGERQSLGVFPTMPPRVDETRRVCPVCKAPCSVPSIVPIYVRTEPVAPDAETAKEGAEASSDAAADVAPLDEVEQDHDYAPQSPPRSASTEAEELQAPGEEESSGAAPLDADPASETTGMRQRRRATTASRSSTAPTSSSAAVTSPAVPARPAANSPIRSPAHSPLPSSSVLHGRSTALVAASPAPGGARGSLALSFQHALASAVQTHQQQQHQHGFAAPSSSYSSSVPPLHRRDGGGPTYNGGASPSPNNPARAAVEGTDPDATEFLSRILLLLGSFVILCLLLF